MGKGSAKVQTDHERWTELNELSNVDVYRMFRSVIRRKMDEAREAELLRDDTEEQADTDSDQDESP